MRILFLASAYYRGEAFASVCKSLERMGHEVTYYPLYTRALECGQEATRGVSVDAETSRRAGLPKVWGEVLQLGARHDMALVWKAELLTPDVVRSLSRLTQTVHYSWDDPYQIEIDKAAIARAVACHVAASCCARSAAIYACNGSPKAVWVPPGYDPEVHYEDGTPEVDVCFIATNTYCKEVYGSVENPPFDRRELVRRALRVTNKVELWGTGDGVFGWLHPAHGDPSFAPYYRGFIGFEEARKAMSRARICVNSHVRRNGYRYFNERTFQIMGCKRMQLIDDNPGTQEVLGYVGSGRSTPAGYYRSLDDFEHNLRNLLATRPWDAPKMVGQLAYDFSKDFTWDRFCQRILEAAR